MTQQEAETAARSAGMVTITPEVLAMFGFHEDEWSLEQVELPVLDATGMTKLKAALTAEAAGNATPAQVMGVLQQVLGFVAPIATKLAL